MPLGNLRQDYVSLPSADPMPQLTGNIDGVAASPSPARALQQQLERRAIEQREAAGEKWSPRRALVFIIAVSATMWIGLIVAGAELIRAIS